MRQNDNQGVILQVDNQGVNWEIGQTNGMQAMASARHRTEAAPRDRASSTAQGRGDRGADARSGPVLLQDTGGRPERPGSITSWGGGAFGFMRSLALLGPLTVPQIAQMRPTSRQRMQRLADELAAEGLVEFIDNPKHRRSKLVRLTRKGDARYRALNVELLDTASTLRLDLSEIDIRKASETVRRLSDELKSLPNGSRPV